MEEDELDPRIQVELEKLNNATDDINKLEIELDEANTTFRMLLNECTRRLKVHSSKYGGAIESARPYYEALDIARRAQQECQRAAVSFQRANEVHEAAKETVALAESRFLSQQPEWRFDSAWQEMLNHATIKVRDAEKQRAESSAYHGQTTAIYKDAQEKVHLLEQRLRRNVAKSRPYFEEKQRCNEQLAAQKEAVEALAAKVARVKAEYAESLRQLEGISEEIHRKRANLQLGGCGVREPGVGAELEYKEELEYCVRETAFDKSSFGRADTSFASRAAVTDYSEINLKCLDDEASPNTTADDDIWLDVEVRRDSFVLPSFDAKGDLHRDSTPDNHTGCGDEDDLHSAVEEIGVGMTGDIADSSVPKEDETTAVGSAGASMRDTPSGADQTGCDDFDNFHSAVEEIGVEMTGDCTDSLVFEKDEPISVGSGVVATCSTPTHTRTPTCSIIQGTNDRDKVENRPEQPPADDKANFPGESVKNLNICVQEVQQDQTAQPEKCDDNDLAYGQENGATHYNDGDIMNDIEENTKSSDFECDFQAQVCTEVVKINGPTLVDNEGLGIIVEGQGFYITDGDEGLPLVGARGDAGDGCGMSNRLANDDLKNAHARSSSAFHPGSQLGDLELTHTLDKTLQVTHKDTVRMTSVTVEDNGNQEASAGSPTNQGN